MFTITLAHLLARAGRFTPHEAVAIAQLLAGSPTGVPAIDNVEVSSEGAVSCISHAGVPSVHDIAVLLDTLLPADTRVPPALRYTIARGMGTVEAPPYQSVADFSSALHRFEALGRDQVVRNLLRRVVHDVHIPSPAETLLGIAPPVATAPVEQPVVAQAPEPVIRIVPAPAPRLAEMRVVPKRGSEDDAPVPVVAVPVRSRSAHWGALAAGMALFASAATGYALVELRHTRSAAPRTDVQQHAPTPAAPVPVRTAARQPATTPPAAAAVPAPPSTITPQPEQPTGTTGRETSAETPLPENTTQPAAGVRVLRAQTGTGFSPAFSRDGAALFFQTGTPRDASSAIAMMPRTTSAGNTASITKIVDDGSRNYHAQPSPDGRLIAFDSDREGERGIYVAQADGSDVHRISGPGYAAVPTWSPDGTKLTYIRAEANRPSVWNLWIQPAHHGPARRLTNHSFGQTWSASWFPDGRRIGYAHEDSLVVLDVTTGRTRKIASPVKGGLIRTPAVSPDGRKIVFQVFRHGAWIVDLSNGTMEHVLSDPTAEEFAWAPDGRIAFHSRRDGQWGIYLLEQG